MHVWHALSAYESAAVHLGCSWGGAVYATAFFRLSKQNKISLKGIQANAGMINTAAGCRDTNCSLVCSEGGKKKKVVGGRVELLQGE